MSCILRQSTSVDVRLGPFVDATDGVTPETGVTLGAADQAELLKANGAATTDISGRTFAAVTGADGWYDLTLTAGDTDTVGDLTIVVQDSSVCLPVLARLQVVEEAVYDAMFAASATGPAQAGDAMDLVTDAVDSNALAASALTDIEDEILDAALSGHTTVGTVGEALNLLDDIESDTSSLVTDLATVDANIDTILENYVIDQYTVDDSVVTPSPTNFGTTSPRGTGYFNGYIIVVREASGTRYASGVVDSYVQTNGEFTMVGSIGFTPANGDEVNIIGLQLQDGVQNGLTDQGYTTARAPNLDNLDAAVSTRSSHSAADVDTTLTGSHGSGSWQTATGFSTHSAADVADAVLDELLSAHTTPGSLSQAISDILTDTAAMQPTIASNLDATVSSRSSHSAADVDTQLSGTHGAGSWATATGFSTHSAADVADAVLDELLSGHTTPGSLSQAIADILADTAAIQPTVATNLDATVSSRAAPGDAMDLVAGAIDSAAFAASGLQAIEDECDDALVGRDLDHLINVAVPGNPTTDSWLDIILNPDGETPFDRNFGSLTAIGERLGLLPNRGDFAKVAVIASPTSTTTEVYTDAAGADDYWNGHVLLVIDAGGGAGASEITDFADADGHFTVSPALPFTPASGDRVYVLPASFATGGGGGLTQQQVRDAMKLAPSGGAPAADSVDDHLDDILADTAAMQPTIASNLDATVSSRSSHSAADVDTQLSGTHGAGSWATATGFSTHSAADVADAVLDELLSGHTTPGSLSQAIADILADTAAMQPTVATNLDAAVSSRSSHSAADVDTQLSGVHGAGSWATATGFPSAAAIADAVLDEALSGHTTAGTVGEALADGVLARKLLQNRFQIDTGTGIATIYDDDGTTPLLTAQLYLDAAGGSPYDGTAAAHRRNAYA